METRTLHFNLSQLPEQEDLQVHANLQDYDLQPHTPATRRQAAQQPGLLRGLTAASLTHFIEDLEMPASRPALIAVSAPGKVGLHATRRTVALKIHVPAAGLEAALAQIEAERLLAPEAEEDEPVLTDYEQQFVRQGYANANAPYTPADFDTAVALLFKHPNLLNLSEEKSGMVAAYIKESCIRPAISQTYALPITIAKLGANWSKKVPVWDEKPDGTREHMTDPDQPGVLLFQDELHPSVKEALQGPLNRALKKAQDSEFLRDRQWTVQHGVVSEQQPDRADPHGEVVLRARGAGGQYKWSLSNLTPSSGLVVNSDVRYVPNNDNNGWFGHGLWADDQQPAAERLTPALAQSFADGKLLLKISSDSYPEGVFLVPLKPEAAVADEPARLRVNEKGPSQAPQAYVRGSFQLNSPRTAIQYLLDTGEVGSQATAALYLETADGSHQHVQDLHLAKQITYGYEGVLYVTSTNHWLRHLGAYVEFLDGAGAVIRPPYGWDAQMPFPLDALFEPNRSKRFLGVLPPVNTLCGIPILAEPTTLRIPVPGGAETIRLLWGGLGTGQYDGDICPLGITLTAAIEVALPIVILAAGTAIGNSKWVNDLLEDKKVLYSIMAVGATIAGSGTAYDANQRGDSSIPLLRLGNALGPLLLKTGLKWFIAKKVAEGTAARAIPFVNIAFQIFGAAVTVAQLAQTTVAVLQSPFVYRTDIGRAIDLDVELVPDRRFHKFPALARRYRVLVTYDKSATTQIMEGDLPDQPIIVDPIHVQFLNVPGGGNMKVFVFLYAANGWQAGQGESGWLRAEGDEGTTMRIRGLQVIENIVPLTTASVYTHLAKLAYRAGRHVWLPGAAPTATPATAADQRHQVLRWGSITLAQAPAALGYAWQATGLNTPRDSDPTGPPANEAMYTAQSISILADPEAGYAAPAVGYTAATGLVYDIGTSNNGEGGNFFIEQAEDKRFHLRRLRPAFNGATQQVVPPVFPTRSNESWGCFPTALDRYVVHPQGYVIGLAYTTAKLYLCPLPQRAQPNDRAPKASLASGEGVREGLLKNPSALAIGLDGAVLVLENQRVQAFDLHGNPVPYFLNPQQRDQKISTLALTEPKGTRYLDLAVEGKGYLYVLSCQGQGSTPADYRMTTYMPNGERLVTTPHVAANKLTVGLDRSVYTLNYEVLEGHNGRTEPSVSQWIPPAPAG